MQFACFSRVVLGFPVVSQSKIMLSLKLLNFLWVLGYPLWWAGVPIGSRTPPQPRIGQVVPEVGWMFINDTRL